MSLQLSMPAHYDPKKHVVLSREHLWDHVGIVDEFGRELTHAHIIEWTQRALGPALMKLLAHRDRHLDDPTHPIHADVHEAFHGRFKGIWRIDRYDAPVEWYAARLLTVKQRGITEQDLAADGAFVRLLTADERAGALAALARDKKNDSSTFEEDDSLENLFTTNGVNCLWTVANAGLGAANTGTAAAAATAAFNTAQSRVGVADGTTAAAAGDTDIQSTGSNKTWQVVSGAPTISTNQMQFAASFGTAAANYAWNNFAVDNCGGSNATSSTRSGGTMLDHLVSSQGTKAAGQTWNPTLSLSVS